MLQCKEIKKCIDGYRRCTYVCRKQFIQSHIASGSHIFNLPADLYSGFSKDKKDYVSIISSRESIRKQIVCIAAKCGISLKGVCSKDFCEFICIIFDIARSLPPTITGSDVVAKPVKINREIY